MMLCDLHTHILPGVDDGAQSLEQALEMLENAVASDVSTLVMTPHCNVPGVEGNYRSRLMEERFAQVRQAAEKLPIDIALGAEVRVTEELPALLQSERVYTLNGSRYLLTEFPVDFPQAGFSDALKRILALGYIPLVAHPERYFAVWDRPGMVEAWLDMGCHIQITGGSIVGEYGKTVAAAARFLLKNDFVACVASDAHGIHRRSNFLLDVYDHLRLYYSRQYANCLMAVNPMRVYRNESL